MATTRSIWLSFDDESEEMVEVSEIAPGQFLETVRLEPSLRDAGRHEGPRFPVRVQMQEESR